MIQYKKMLKYVLENGKKREDRTGTGTLEIFGYQNRYCLNESFPIVTTKKVNFTNVVGELLWILSGSTNNNDLRQITYGADSTKKTIWEEWADERGNLGNIYGSQLRYWADEHEFGYEDQLKNVLWSLKHIPFSRRHIIDFWNPSVLPDETWTPQKNVEEGYAALPPCHLLVQFNVTKLPLLQRMKVSQNMGYSYADYKITDGIELHLDSLDIPTYGISCQLYQRSADIFLGVPYNISSYCLLTYIIGKELNYLPLEFIHSFGSLHLYTNHIEQAKLQLTRKCKKLPTLGIQQDKNIDTYTVKDFQLVNYQHHDFIRGDIAV